MSVQDLVKAPFARYFRKNERHDLKEATAQFVSTGEGVEILRLEGLAGQVVVIGNIVPYAMNRDGSEVLQIVEDLRFDGHFIVDTRVGAGSPMQSSVDLNRNTLLAPAITDQERFEAGGITHFSTTPFTDALRTIPFLAIEVTEGQSLSVRVKKVGLPGNNPAAAPQAPHAIGVIITGAVFSSSVYRRLVDKYWSVE